jgi:transcriptional regulator with XRE-family HTH domain
MGTPLGDFIRTRRDSTQPESLGLPDVGRRRAPGLRRTDLAARAGISVEYLTRIEQGRDRNPSVAVVNALADALSLDPAERSHLRYLTKITGGVCSAHTRPQPPRHEVRAEVLETLRLLEPGIAVVTNRLGDILARTSGYEAVMGETGLLDTGLLDVDADADLPNITRYLFTDPRARTLFVDWDDVANEQAFDLWLAPSLQNTQWFTAQLAPLAGAQFTNRLNRHIVPRRGALRLHHPSGDELEFRRETLELASDAQQIVVYLPAQARTAEAVDRLRHRPPGHPNLRAVS